jgi:predicted DNA-binding ribbon-helix-helix protein
MKHPQENSLDHMPAQPPRTGGSARPIKRSFTIAGHATSISLEAAFWDALKRAAQDRRMPVARLVAEIDEQRGDTNLSSAVRVWILTDLQQRRIPDSG